MNKQALLALPLFLLATASAREDPQQSPPQNPPLDTGQRLAALEQVVVPVGGVILWWGDASALPPGFEVCDGTVPFHRNATLKERKPDLRDRFVKCAKDISGYRPRNALEGGANETPVRRTLPYALKPDDLPPHQHPIAHVHGLQAHTHGLPNHTHGLTSHQHLIGSWIDALLSGTGSQVLTQNANGPASTQPGGAGNTGPGGAGSTEAGGGGQTLAASPAMSGSNATQNTGHFHEIPSFDNRPAFLEMLYIIRVL
jgi:hypothetical protein